MSSYFLSRRSLLALPLLSLSALASRSNAASGPASPRMRSVRLGYGVRVIGPDAAMYTSVPKKEGFWESQGLDVSIQSLNTGPAYQLLAQGKLDFLIAGSASGIPMVEQGADIVAVASSYRTNIFYPAVLSDSDITSMRQMKGKSIGVFTPAGTGVLMLDAVLREYGLTRQDLKGVTTVGTGAAALNALKTRQIDIYFGYQGAYNTIEATADVKFRRFTDDPLVERTAFVSPGVWTRRSLVQDDPQAVLGFLRGIVMGVRFAREDPAAAIRDHFDLYPQTKPQGSEAEAIKDGVQSLTNNLKTFSDPYGRVDAGAVDATVNMMHEAGIIKTTGPASKYYLGTFIEQANQIDMKLVDKALKK